MKKIKLIKLSMQNFKGCKERVVNFDNKTEVYGANATGKTTLIDAFMWLMFDKDSTGASKFQIRPLDCDGKQIDNVDIVVDAVLEIDDKPIVFTKTQKQKWVKKRGSATSELQGNENIYSINDYPKTEKDFKEYVAGIINEDLFKMITNPMAFVSLPWKKQREVLMTMIGEDVSDIEIAMSENDFHELVPELEMASTDDIHKKYTKALNTWKKKQVEIPARIDEVSRSISSIDVAELELHKNALIEKYAEIKKMFEKTNSSSEEKAKADAEINRIKTEMRKISAEAENIIASERKRLSMAKMEADNEFQKSRKCINLLELDIDKLEREISGLEELKRKYQADWREIKASVFDGIMESVPDLDDDAMTCPTCGRELPEDEKAKRIELHQNQIRKSIEIFENAKKNFEDGKKMKLELITELGNKVVADIKNGKAHLELLKEKLREAKEVSMACNKKESDISYELSKIPMFPDLSNNQEYEALELELARAMQYSDSIGHGTGYQNQLRNQLLELDGELNSIQLKIDSVAISEERLEELKEEQREVAQKVADQERKLFLLEEFIKLKMNKVSNLINSKFKTVNFKLFSDQINGGMKECCECTVNGVPFSSLNNGHKIVAGLDIISSLCELYEISCPIFIDNAESMNNYNIPTMDGQMILLRVSDDKDLRVEV